MCRVFTIYLHFYAAIKHGLVFLRKKIISTYLLAYSSRPKCREKHFIVWLVWRNWTIRLFDWLIDLRSGQSGAVLEAWCRPSGMTISRTRHRRRRVFSIFLLVLWGLNQLLTVAKIQKQSRTFFQDFLPWNERFECRSSKWLNEKSRNDVFSDTLPKTWHSTFFVLICSCLCQRNHTGTQKKLFLRWDDLGSLGLCWISLKLKITAADPETLILRLLQGIQKKHLFRNFRPNRSRSATQKSFFRRKNPGRLHRTFSGFLQQPEVSSLITLTIKNMKNDVPLAVSKRHHPQRAAPRAIQSAELPLMKPSQSIKQSTVTS